MPVHGHRNAMVVAGSALAEQAGGALEHAAAAAQLAVERLRRARTGLANAVRCSGQQSAEGPPSIGNGTRVAVGALRPRLKVWYRS